MSRLFSRKTKKAIEAFGDSPKDSLSGSFEILLDNSGSEPNTSPPRSETFLPSESKHRSKPSTSRLAVSRSSKSYKLTPRLSKKRGTSHTPATENQKQLPPKRPSGHISFLNASNTTEGVTHIAEQTISVMQAQELGEQTRFKDDASWALEGLNAASSEVDKRESMCALAEMCVNKKGRLALRCGGMADEVLDAVSTAYVGDAIVALAAATILATLCLPDAADPKLLTLPAAVSLFEKLLHAQDVIQGPENSSLASNSPESRIAKCLQERLMLRVVPKTESLSPLSITLAALAILLDPNLTPLNIEALKIALGEAGVIDTMAQCALRHAHAVADPAPTIETVRCLWRLHKCLKILEHMCFASPENESRLIAVDLISGENLTPSKTSLITWLVNLVGAMSSQGLAPGIKKDCLRATLSVLMNASQNNAVGCQILVEANLTKVIPRMLQQMLQGDGRRHVGCLASGSSMIAWADEVSSCMGLLINIAEQSQKWRQELRSGTTLVPLLCSLITAVVTEVRDPAEAVTGGGAVTEDVTLDTLQGKDDAGAGSIIELYASILLGFIIEESQNARNEAASRLPGRDLESVTEAVERALHFYVSTGAITQRSERNLRELVDALRKPATVD